MISKKMVSSMNEQINKELYSAYLYTGMASFASSIGLAGFANWFTVQTQEEVSHAQKFYNYVNQQGGRVILKAIDEPPQAFKTATDLFAKTLEHERVVTGLINKLVGQAKEEKDYATEIFLQWFVTEQVEEEENASVMLQQLKLVGNDGNGLYLLDKELSQRVFTPPASSAA